MCKTAQGKQKCQPESDALTLRTVWRGRTWDACGHEKSPQAAGLAVNCWCRCQQKFMDFYSFDSC